MYHRIHTAIPTREYLQTLAVRTVGNFLVLTSVFFLVKTVYQPVFEEVAFFMNTVRGTSYVVQDESIPSSPPATPGQGNGFAQLFQNNRVEVLVPEDPNFSLVIPKIGANAPVVPNVNPGSEEEYQEALTRGIAHARGTSFPGEGGHVFLFAHSTDYLWNLGSYNAVFYLLYKMEIGDEVSMFYQGQRYTYVIEEKVIIEADDVEYLTRKTDYELLTLQTCWPPGTTLKRLIVSGRRISE